MNTQEIILNQQSKSFLLETAKWAKFLAIMGFIMIGFMVLFGVFFSTIMGTVASMNPTGAFVDSAPFGFIGIIYVIMALLYFFPILYLYKFATKMKNAFQNNNDSALTEAFSNLKSHYKFVGIFTIIIVGIYILMFLFSGIMFASLN